MNDERVKQVHPHVAISRGRFARVFGEAGPGSVTVKEVLERLAEAILAEHAVGNEDCAVPLRGLKRLFMQEADAILAATVTLEDARQAVAVEHAFDDWDDVEVGCDRRLDPAFEAAVDAVVDGRIDALRAALDANPGLVTESSPYGHKCTLLHYVAANGVELRRQTSPENLPEITALLLERGAAVDARAGTYGGDANQTPLLLLVTSGHPAEAGVQVDVLKLLLEHGAAPDGLDGGGAPLRYALEFGHDEAARALVDAGATIDDLAAAAGLGIVKRVAELYDDAESDARGRALVRAAQYGRKDVVVWLLDRGVAAGAAPDRGVTALHEAAYGGHEEVVDLLLARGADATQEDDVHHSTPAVWADVGGHEDLVARLRDAESKRKG